MNELLYDLYEKLYTPPDRSKAFDDSVARSSEEIRRPADDGGDIPRFDCGVNCSRIFAIDFPSVKR